MGKDKAQQNFAEMVRDFLRKKAPHVKNFIWDRYSGTIECFERQDLGPKGYKVVKQVFKSFEELKTYYQKVKHGTPKKSIKAPSKPARRRS